MTVLERIAPNVRIGPLGKLLAPSYGSCRRCETPWAFVKHHSTALTPHKGCFALCEMCWEELLTPAARVPYYRDLYDSWLTFGPVEEPWEDIERAVLEGG